MAYYGRPPTEESQQGQDIAPCHGGNVLSLMASSVGADAGNSYLYDTETIVAYVQTDARTTCLGVGSSIQA